MYDDMLRVPHPVDRHRGARAPRVEALTLVAPTPLLERPTMTPPQAPATPARIMPPPRRDVAAWMPAALGAGVLLLDVGLLVAALVVP